MSYAASLRAYSQKRIGSNRHDIRTMAACAMTEWLIHEALHSLAEDKRDGNLIAEIRNETRAAQYEND